MSEIVSGNSCLFGLLRLSNLLLALVGLGTIGLGVYATSLAKKFDWYSGTFIIFGFAMFIVALFGYKNRKHPHLMIIYLLLVLGVLVCLTGLTLGVIFYPEYASKVGGETHANLIRYSLLGICGVALSCLLFGCWYRSSLSDAIFDYENKPKDAIRPLVTPKTDKVREDMYKKYPQLKEMHEKVKS